MVDEAGDGQSDLEVIAVLDEGVEWGRTTCPACGTQAAGFPRACLACARALPGTPDPAVAGLLPTESPDEVRAAAEGEFEVLGLAAHPGGASALYFARDLARRRIVGLALHAETAGGEHSLVVAWEPEGAPEPSAPAILLAAPASEAWSVAPSAAIAPAPWAAPPPRDDPPPEFAREPRRRGRSGGVAAYAACWASPAWGCSRSCW